MSTVSTKSLQGAGVASASSIHASSGTLSMRRDISGEIETAANDATAEEKPLSRGKKISGICFPLLKAMGFTVLGFQVSQIDDFFKTNYAKILVGVLSPLGFIAYWQTPSFLKSKIDNEGKKNPYDFTLEPRIKKYVNTSAAVGIALASLINHFSPTLNLKNISLTQRMITNASSVLGASLGMILSNLFYKRLEYLEKKESNLTPKSVPLQVIPRITSASGGV
ncbi:MAG: hypothetical protein JXA94_00685 [Parachlamydiales bacterium]|nr:hypothetical protein [Parachlamydiales bacterium]